MKGRIFLTAICVSQCTQKGKLLSPPSFRVGATKAYKYYRLAFYVAFIFPPKINFSFLKLHKIIFLILIYIVYRKELQRHMRNAHDPSQRKYKCDDCGKCYLTKSILERHKGTHTLVKPHKVRIYSSLFFNLLCLMMCVLICGHYKTFNE